MAFVVGVILFALGITISVALHECGHMWAAKATGMKVRRYYIGFGPKVFSFRRGETEYGLKALPLGGFCDIAGMTALDELQPDEIDRAMYRQKAWKRLVVMFGGIGMNFVLGFIVIAVLAVTWGLPSMHEPSATLGELGCVATERMDETLASCTGKGPAERAGLREGDLVKSVNGVAVGTWSDFVTETQKQSGPLTYSVERDGRTFDVTVTPQPVARLFKDPAGKKVSRTVGAIGAAAVPHLPTRYGPIDAVPASLSFTGDLAVQTLHSLTQIPSKVGALWHAVTGGERDPDTPVSVYGASVIGGQSAERGYWDTFLLLLASLNFFLGAFNLLPLLPLDGGHIAVVLYERIRNLLRGRRGLPPGVPVDYMKLMPVTYAVVVVGGLYMLLTLTADIVNPIKVF